MRFSTMWYVRPAKPRISLAYVHSDQSLCVESLEYSLNVKQLTEHHLKFLSLKGGYTGSSESIHVKIPQYYKSLIAAHVLYELFGNLFKT